MCDLNARSAHFHNVDRFAAVSSIAKKRVCVPFEQRSPNARKPEGEQQGDLAAPKKSRRAKDGAQASWTPSVSYSSKQRNEISQSLGYSLILLLGVHLLTLFCHLLFSFVGTTGNTGNNNIPIRTYDFGIAEGLVQDNAALQGYTIGER